MRLGGRFWRDRSGASAVEFALLAVPLVVLMFGTIEFGRLMWIRQALEETATASARCMAIPQPQCMSGNDYNALATRTFIRSEAGSWGLAIADDDITINRAGTCSGLPDFSVVRIQHQFESAVPGLVEAMAVGPSLVSEVCFPNQAG